MQKELIVKSNEILAHPIYKTSIELKIFSRIILELRNNPEKNIFYLNKKELLESLGCDKNSYGELKKVAERMFRPIDINKGKGNFILRAVFIEINADFESEILFEISPKMKPYFLDLTKNFTQYYFQNIARLKSSFSIRIYELLKQYENIGNRKITVLELRNFLNIDEWKYKLYGDFKRKTILVAKKELKEKTDIYFEFEEIKTGRKITEIKFIIFKNIKTVESDEAGNLDQEALSEEQEQLKNKLVKEYGIAGETAKGLVLAVTIETIEKNILYTEKEHGTGKVKKNIAGFLIKSIKNNYAGNVSLFQEEEKKKQAETKKKQYLEEQRKKLTNELSNQFDIEERDKFISSLDEQQQQALLDEILSDKSMNIFLISAVKKSGLKSPFAYSYIIERIENFRDKKEAFIAQGLKKANL